MIDKALSGLFKVVTEEAAANPTFARRLEDSLAKFAEDHAAARRAGARIADFHPHIEYPKATPEAFRKRLGGFDATELRMIVAKHRLDPAGTLKPRASKKVLVEHVFNAAQKRAERDAKLFEY
ncbi:MAG: hypothetical protein GC155_00765 [Alphaproteobacteria bacterium]|nr:hypothetical protein [Alphaproteobacteria bacterium]